MTDDNYLIHPKNKVSQFMLKPVKILEELLQLVLKFSQLNSSLAQTSIVN